MERLLESGLALGECLLGGILGAVGLPEQTEVEPVGMLKAAGGRYLAGPVAERSAAVVAAGSRTPPLAARPAETRRGS